MAISSLTLSVLMRIVPTIHYNTGYIHYIVQELMNLQLHMEIGFLPRRISLLTLSVLP